MPQQNRVQWSESTALVQHHNKGGGGLLFHQNRRFSVTFPLPPASSTFPVAPAGSVMICVTRTALSSMDGIFLKVEIRASVVVTSRDCGPATTRS